MRSRPGGRLEKIRRRQSATLKVKRRATKTARSLASSPAGHETKLALLTRERDGAFSTRHMAHRPHTVTIGVENLFFIQPEEHFLGA